MQEAAHQQNERRELRKSGVDTVPVVRNFRQVIGSRDMSLMKKELYQFLHLHCGFIAHYNIHGFQETYAAPTDFADIFIRHFDEDHRYFCGNYACHEEPYRESGYTKAEIKEAFFRIVASHKDAIERWARDEERNHRFAAFQVLRKEFEHEEKSIHIVCELCGEEMDLRIEGWDHSKGVPDNLCCLFCGHPIETEGERR